MKLISSNSTSRGEFFQLKDENYLKDLRVAGRCVADVMLLLKNLVKDKTTLSLKEINDFAGDEIEKRNCKPTFYLYKGFPGKICISTNKELVHGVPNDYKLKEGDVITFDFGATFNSAIADSAMTVIYGEPKSKTHINGINTANKCLENAIKSIAIGKRIGCIGNAIFKTARDAGFTVIEQYGGHGIDFLKDGTGIPHSAPFIANKSTVNDGIHIDAGFVCAIEPLLVPISAGTETKVGSDGWTVYSKDISYHSEHTIYVHKDGTIENITERII